MVSAQIPHDLAEPLDQRLLFAFVILEAKQIIFLPPEDARPAIASVKSRIFGIEVVRSHKLGVHQQVAGLHHCENGFNTCSLNH